MAIIETTRACSLRLALLAREMTSSSVSQDTDQMPYILVTFHLTHINLHCIAWGSKMLRFSPSLLPTLSRHICIFLLQNILKDVRILSNKTCSLLFSIVSLFCSLQLMGLQTHTFLLYIFLQGHLNQISGLVQFSHISSIVTFFIYCIKTRSWIYCYCLK